MEPSPGKKARTEHADIADDLVRRSKRGWPTHLKNTDDAATLRRELAQHHGAHPNAKIEWWYASGHLDNDMSFFVAFFRVALTEDQIAATGSCCPEEKALKLQALNWALIDRRNSRYFTVGKHGHASCAATVRMMSMQDGPFTSQDPFVGRAMIEMMNEGKMLLPDEVMTVDAKCDPNQGTLDIDFDGSTMLWSEATQSFKLVLCGSAHDQIDARRRPVLRLALEVTAVKPPVLHGVDGVVSVGTALNDMYYYCFPRCSAAGQLTIDGATTEVRGSAWVDHEFGGSIPTNPEELRVVAASAKSDSVTEVSWQWAALQLDNDVEVSLTTLTNGTETQRFAIVREGTASAIRIDNIEFAPVAGCTWTSSATGATFPTRWEATIRHADAIGGTSNLSFSVSVPHQEFITLAAKPSFWEGHVSVTGVWRGGAAVKGDAFMEVHQPHDATAMAGYYALMNTLLVAPNVAALQQQKPATVEAAVALLAAAVEMFAMMAAMQTKVVTPPAAKKALAATVAIVYFITEEPHRAHEHVARCNEQWLREWAPALPNDLKRIMLRAWMLKELNDASTTTPPPAAPVAVTATVQPARASPTEESYAIATEAELATAALPEVAAAARAAFAGAYKMDRTQSDSLSDMLKAQQVNMVIRQLTDRLVPTLNVTVTETQFVTDIKTPVSKQVVITNFDGSPTPWFSSGRGNLTTRACLMNGGRTLYMRTSVPPESAPGEGIEHKWFTSLDDGTMIERYAYKTTESAAPVVARRVFLRQP